MGINAILAYSASVNCKVLVIIIFKYKVLNDHHNIVSWEFANKSTIAQHSVPLTTPGQEGILARQKIKSAGDVMNCQANINTLFL